MIRFFNNNIYLFPASAGWLPPEKCKVTKGELWVLKNEDFSKKLALNQEVIPNPQYEKVVQCNKWQQKVDLKYGYRLV